MVTRLALEQWSDWLKPGNTDDSRLLHSDNSDRIYVCLSELGQGYVQEIPLRDDLTLVIKNYQLERDLIIDKPSHDGSLTLSFPLTDSSNARYSTFNPCFGLREIDIVRSHRQVFEVQVIFAQSTFVTYLQEFMARLLPQTLDIAEQVVRSIYQHQKGYSTSNNKEMLDKILQDGTDANSDAALEQILSSTVYSDMAEIGNAGRNLISAAMEQVIGQILSCPYQDATRRTYLKQKALKLTALYFDEGMLRSRLNQSDFDYIHQAGQILKSQSLNPPTVDRLARQVGTSRSKLNRDFHQLYNTTPFGYLRDRRLRQARRLLMTSELSVEQVAATVGYSSRSHFAIAFRQQYGINPKVLSDVSKARC